VDRFEYTVGDSGFSLNFTIGALFRRLDSLLVTVTSSLSGSIQLYGNIR
jgi:hypothetical protein